MDMLVAVKVGADKPTQIMYRANLSWIALQTHLKQLLERGLLIWVADGSRKRYELTTKGANVMYSYIKILEETGEDTTDYLTVGM
jgi:predicted transcriptional regulator